MPCASREAIGRFPNPSCYQTMSLPSHTGPNLSGPTPPSSTTAIPPLCFPSPTSVAHVVNPAPETPVSTHSHSPHSPGKDSSSPSSTSQFCHSPILDSHSQNSSPSRSPAASDSCASLHDNPSQQSPRESNSEFDHQHHHYHSSQIPHPQPPSPSQQQSVNIATPHYYYHRLDLSNPSPSPPLERVNKATFTAALEHFIARAPPNEDPSDEQLVQLIRVLLDHLDALIEQLALRVTNALFDVLSHPNCLRLLLFLLSDTSACSSPIITDVRKSYRYPYLVANILANGNVAIRDAFVGSSHLVTHLLSFLDGHVVLSNPQRNALSSNSSPRQPMQQVFARENPVIVGNVVQILVSYLETSPEPLLQAINARPTFIPALVNLLDVGSVPKVFSSIILERCVDEVCMMDVQNATFDGLMSSALSILSNSAIFHLLSHAFVGCTQTIFGLVHDGNGASNQELHTAQEHSFNILQVFGALVNKTIRCVRLKPNDPLCSYLHVFANAETAKTVTQTLRAGIELFRVTDGEQVGTLNVALKFAVELLKYIEQDSERRVASVTGQPPSLETFALEAELDPVLQSLMSVLIDTVGTGIKHGETRLRIMEMFVEVGRVCCSDNVVGMLDRVRFGQVGLKLMMLNRSNSLLHHVLCRGVESALVYGNNEMLMRHWLVRSRLMQMVMTTWIEVGGDEKWKDTGHVDQWPLLSTIVHLGCCIVHWIAITRERNTTNAGDIVGEEMVERFEHFFATKLGPMMEEEKAVLGGPRPRRRPTRMSGGSLGRSFGSFAGTQGGMLKRMSSSGGGGERWHMVRSSSAHRFGYVAPVSTARSRFDDMFNEDEGNGFGGGGGFVASGGSSGASSFASIFDVEPGSSL